MLNSITVSESSQELLSLLNLMTVRRDPGIRLSIEKLEQLTEKETRKRGLDAAELVGGMYSSIMGSFENDDDGVRKTTPVFLRNGHVFTIFANAVPT